MVKYRKKPVVIDAFKWTGDREQLEDPIWIVEAIANGTVTIRSDCSSDVKLVVKTLEGEMTANRGDYIIRGVKGEIYPCKADIFEQTYEAVGCENCKGKGRVWDCVGEYYYDCPYCSV